MTREHKLALIVGFSLVLVLGVLLSDHFSKARNMAPAMASASTGQASNYGAGNALSSATPPSKLPESQPPVTIQTPGTGNSQVAMGTPSGRIPGSVPLEAAGGDVRGQSLPGMDRPLAGVVSERVPVDPGQGTQGGTPSSGLPVSREPLKRHEVKEGDSIYRIASAVYGDGNLWSKIREYSGNKGKIGDNGAMREGVTILLPPKDVLLGKAVLMDERVGGSTQGIGQSSPMGSRTGEITMSGNPSRGETRGTDGSKLDSGRADSKSENKPDVKTATYTVKEGDTLASIARKKLGSAGRTQDIIALNKSTLDDPDSLKVGMVLKLPVR